MRIEHEIIGSSPPSPLRGGTEGGGAAANANAELSDSAAPPPLTPPLKGEGDTARAFDLATDKDH